MINISGECQAPVSTTGPSTTVEGTTGPSTTIEGSTEPPMTTTDTISSTTTIDLNGTTVTPMFDILCGNIENFALSNVTVR